MKKKYNVPPHDALVKQCLGNLPSAREFLDEYLPQDFRNLIDLRSLKIQKDSFIEENLRSKYSDVIYSLDFRKSKVGDSQKGLVYVLIEHQSSSDYWIAFRLMKYSLLLLEKYAKPGKKEKLPLIFPMVFYNGKGRYRAPKNLSKLFENPDLAQKYMLGDYHLIDLQKMSDDDINYDKHHSMLLYVMKHIHDRDMLNMLENMFGKCKRAILIDKQNEYIHFRSVLWYTQPKIEEGQHKAITEVINKNLPEEEGEYNMRSLADKYFEEGYYKGEAEGEARGEAKGAAQATMDIVHAMLKRGLKLSEVAKLTGIGKDSIKKIIKQQDNSSS